MSNVGSQRVLVTGASGFVGRTLTAALLAQGVTVVTFSRSPMPPELAEQVTHVESDLLDEKALTEAMAGVAIVFHLASVAHVYGPDQGELQRVVISGTDAVLQAATAAGVPRIVFFSSILARQAEEGSAQATQYGQAKLQAEKILQAANAVEAVILRPVNVFGAGMQGNLQRLINMIGAGRLPPLPALTTRMALVSVTDLAQAALLLAQEPAAAGSTYAIADGTDYRLHEIEAAIYRAWGRRQPSWRCPRVLLYGAALAMEVIGLVRPARRGLGLRTYRNLVADHCIPDTAALEQLGFQAQTTFYQELPALVQATGNPRTDA